jgi:hypothetical protein
MQHDRQEAGILAEIGPEKDENFTASRENCHSATRTSDNSAWGLFFSSAGYKYDRLSEWRLHTPPNKTELVVGGCGRVR